VLVRIARYDHSSDVDSVTLLRDRHHRDDLLGTTLASRSNNMENSWTIA
jgi:hypothetical protein